MFIYDKKKENEYWRSIIKSKVQFDSRSLSGYFFQDGKDPPNPQTIN